MSEPQETAPAGPTAPDRPLGPAIRNGLRLRCPKCGVGAIFNGYLAVNRYCPYCGEALYHQRADDGPAYLTILVVVHLVGIVLPIGFEVFGLSPPVLALFLSLLAVGTALIMLPRMKGMMIAIQWAKRMHGFVNAEPAGAGTASPSTPAEAPPQVGGK